MDTDKNELQDGCKGLERPVRDRAILSPRDVEAELRTSNVQLPTSNGEPEPDKTRRRPNSLSRSILPVGIGLIGLMGLIGPMRGATVTGTLGDVGLSGLATKITFTPTNTVLVAPGFGLSAGPAKTIDSTNDGSFSVVLDAGDYVVKLPLVPWRSAFGISVPRTNGTLNITNLLTGPRTYTYTNNYTGVDSNGVVAIVQGLGIGNNAGAGTNNILRDARLTNFTQVATGAGTLGISGTNGTGYSGTGAMVWNFLTGTNSLDFKFGDESASSGQLFINRTHGGAGTADNPALSEWQLALPGHIAIGPGYGSGTENSGHIQLGIGPGKYWGFWQFGITKGSVTPIVINDGDQCMSGLQAWRASWRTNGVLTDRYPGICGQATGLNGEHELTVFMNMTGLDGWSTNDINNTRVTGFYAGGTNGQRGVDLRGGLIQEARMGLAASTNCALDFGRSYFSDFSAAATGISFYTTNQSGVTGNYERRVFQIVAGGTPATFTYPAWRTNKGLTLPPSIASGEMLRLELETYGRGETNVSVVSAGVFNDPTFVWDTDALNFISRASLTDPVLMSAVNYLAVNLKAQGLWTKCDAIYPFIGGNETAHLQNLRTNARNLTASGTVTHNANGVTGNGSDGYFSTGYVPSSGNGVFALNSAHLFIYSGTASPATGKSLMGVAVTGTDYFILRTGAASDWLCNGPNNGQVSDLDLSNAGDYRGPVLGTRTGSTSAAIYDNAGSDTGSVASSALASSQIFILARNFGGTDQFSNCNLRGASFGSGMTAGDWTNMKTIWDAYNLILGRKVP